MAIDYSTWTFAQLRSACKEQGLKANGKKDELIERLVENTVVEVEAEVVDYSTWSFAELRSECKAKGIKASGKKADLIKALESLSGRVELDTEEVVEVNMSPEEEAQLLRERLTEFYTEINPAKLMELDNIISLWGNKEDEMMKGFETRYGTTPMTKEEFLKMKVEREQETLRLEAKAKQVREDILKEFETQVSAAKEELDSERSALGDIGNKSVEEENPTAFKKVDAYNTSEYTGKQANLDELDMENLKI